MIYKFFILIYKLLGPFFYLLKFLNRFAKFDKFKFAPLLPNGSMSPFEISACSAAPLAVSISDAYTLLTVNFHHCSPFLFSLLI